MLKVDEKQFLFADSSNKINIYIVYYENYAKFQFRIYEIKKSFLL